MPVKTDYINGKLYTDTRTILTVKLDAKIASKLRAYSTKSKLPIWKLVESAVKSYLSTAKK